MTLTQQIAVLRKVAKLDKSKAQINLDRTGYSGDLSIWVHYKVSGKAIMTTISGIQSQSCAHIEGYDKIIRVLDKMIAQYKELAK